MFTSHFWKTGNLTWANVGINEQTNKQKSMNEMDKLINELRANLVEKKERNHLKFCFGRRKYEKWMNELCTTDRINK